MVVLEILEQLAVVLVRAAQSDDLHSAARDAAVLSRDAVGNHFEFRHRVQQGHIAGNGVPAVSSGDSVDEIFHTAGPAAVDAGVGSPAGSAAIALDITRKDQQLRSE